jgi:hypothetical protein
MDAVEDDVLYLRPCNVDVQEARLDVACTNAVVHCIH